MRRLILFNKPYGVLCQFSAASGRITLKDFIPIPGVYPAGRLDAESEGLLLLTDDGSLQHRISDPRHKLPKTYYVQVEGVPTADALETLARGIDLGDFVTRPARVAPTPPPDWLWTREPPIRNRKLIPANWITMTLTEGRNRQVRRMTAAAGFPTLRLIRYSIGSFDLEGLAPGGWRETFIPSS